jgi:poly-beta-1,6-N-acetyl-D-glucosamine biosynthesis protein PgaD
MEKSRQRDTYPRIIDRPELKSRARLTTEKIITLVFWSAYIYCLLPILKVMSIGFGLNFLGRDGFITHDAPPVLTNLLLTVAEIALVAVASLGIWILYNYLKSMRKGEREIKKAGYAGEGFGDLPSTDRYFLDMAKEHHRILVDVTSGEIACSSRARLAVPEEPSRPIRGRIGRLSWMKKFATRQPGLLALLSLATSSPFS